MSLNRRGLRLDLVTLVSRARIGSSKYFRISHATMTTNGIVKNIHASFTSRFGCLVHE